MPGWHAKTKDLVEAGSLQVFGIVQEQHPDRAALFMQWKEMDWPVLADPFNVLGVKVVPITLLIDERGVIRYRNPKVQDLKRFMDSDYSSEPKPERRKLDQVKIVDLEKVKPESAVQHFQLGVAYRKRFDSNQRNPGDFAKAIGSWQKALSLDPNQYIWRRRIQQYGPRLDKPYSFYDWVKLARREVLERGEKPHPLKAEPRGSEFAYPGKKGGEVVANSPNPDPQKKVALDKEKLIGAQVVVVPSTKGDGKSVRVHLRFTPNAKKAVHWTNDAGPLAFYLEESADFVIHDLTVTEIPKNQLTSHEERLIEIEIRPKAGKSLPDKLEGNAYYYVCEGVDGACLFLRNEIEVEIE